MYLKINIIIKEIITNLDIFLYFIKKIKNKKIKNFNSSS